MAAGADYRTKRNKATAGVIIGTGQIGLSLFIFFDLSYWSILFYLFWRKSSEFIKISLYRTAENQYNMMTQLEPWM